MISVMRDVRAGRGSSFDHIEAARVWLEARADCTGTIGVIGYCMEGGSPWCWPPIEVQGVQRQLRHRSKGRLRGELPEKGLPDRRELRRQGPCTAGGGRPP